MVAAFKLLQIGSQNALEQLIQRRTQPDRLTRPQQESIQNIVPP